MLYASLIALKKANLRMEQSPPTHYKPYLAYYHFKLISLCGRQFYTENKKLSHSNH